MALEDLLSQIGGYLGLGGAGGGGLAFWQARQNLKDIDKLKEQLLEHKQEAADQALYGANTYAKIGDVKYLIDDVKQMVKEQSHDIKEIKNLLIKK